MSIKGLPYTGSKYPIIDQLLPHLVRPEFVNFYDMMCGGGTVAANVPYQNIVMNDINQPIINILRNIIFRGSENTVLLIKHIMSTYDLSSTNKLGYLKCRKEYNTVYNNDPFILLTMLYHAYNNMTRFNKKNHFNVPFGARTFNTQAEANLREFIDALAPKQVLFTNGSIGVWDFEQEPKESLFYFDPPYSIGKAAYNATWRRGADAALFNLLDSLTDMGHAWAMSNVIQNNGKRNIALTAWAERYIVTPILHTYAGSYVNRANKGNTVEVLIRNYV